MDDGDLARLRGAGLGDEEIVQATTIAAVFNHLTRVADATGVEPDYPSPLPRIAVDKAREPLPRPAPEAWPRPAPRLALALRPMTEAAVARWRAYAFAPSDALSTRDREVVARAVAADVGDGASVGDLAAASPSTDREATLATYAASLSAAPWRSTAESLAPLRALGMDDRGVLDVVATVGFLSMASRLRLVLGG